MATTDIELANIEKGTILGNVIKIKAVGNTAAVQKGIDIYLLINEQSYIFRFVQPGNNPPTYYLINKETDITIMSETLTSLPSEVLLPDIATFIGYSSLTSAADPLLQFTIPGYQPGIKGLLWKIMAKLEFLERRFNYCEDIISNFTSLTSQATFSSDISGVTVQNSSLVYLAGNILHIYLNLALTSAAQSTIGTGNLNPNKEIAKITIPNFIYRGKGLPRDEAINYIRHGPSASISVVSGMDDTIMTGTSYTSKMANFHALLTASGLDDNDEEVIGTGIITVTIDAVQASANRYHLTIDIPVTRAYVI